MEIFFLFVSDAKRVWVHTRRSTVLFGGRFFFSKYQCWSVTSVQGLEVCVKRRLMWKVGATTFLSSEFTAVIETRIVALPARSERSFQL